MKISISVTNYSWPDTGNDLVRHLDEVARAADAAGVDTLWVADHLVQADPSAGGLDQPMLEAYTTLAYLAAVTRTVRLGTMVTWAGIRPATLLIKTVTTIDVLSRGRAWLGIGAGYRGDEAHMMGLPFGPTPDRFEILEETLELATRMWSGDAGPFSGRHIEAANPLCRPVPADRPRVLIGGMGEKRTLPLVARRADACNLFDIPDGGETVRRKLSVLEGLCEEIGRPATEVEKTLSARLEPEESSTSLIERCRRFSTWGIDHVVLITAGPWQPRGLETVGVAVDAVADLGA